MPLSMTKGDGFAVFTVTNDSGSKLPLLCQICAALCCTPACLVPRRLRKLTTGTFSALATVQIIVGLLTIGLGPVLMSVYYGPYFMRDVVPPYWSGAAFIISGIFCIFAERFSSPCLVSSTVVVNLVSAGLAVAAIALYAVDDGPRLADACVSYDPYEESNSEDGYGTRHVERMSNIKNISESNFQLCQMYKGSALPIVMGVKVLLGVLALLLICVNISVAVLGIKALKNNSEAEEVPDVQQPLVEEVTANPDA